MKIIDSKALTERLKNISLDEKKEFIKNFDAITTSTFAVISSVSFIFEIKFAESGKYKVAKEAYIDKDKVCIGPAPNEGLGILDGIVNRPKFLNKLLNNEKVEIKIKALDYKNKLHTLKFFATKKDFLYQKLLFTRVCVKNYMAFTSFEKVETIFAYDYLNKGELTFSGCGILNPLEIFEIKKGDKIFIAGGSGLVLGSGTRSSKEKPNLSVLVDFKEVDKKYFGNFYQKSSLEYYVAVGYKKKVRDLTPKETENLFNKSMESIKLPIANVKGRKIIDFSNYKEAWQGDLSFKFDKSKCKSCKDCIIEKYCPAQAFSKEVGFLENCLYCGVCLSLCPFKAIKGNLGYIKNYKIKMRHSSLKRALDVCNLLKDL